jgi:acetyltransferase-like isoleucine patch superfamily enzyme
VRIGRFCSIGQNVRNSFALHPAREFVSTHPAFFSPAAQAGFTFSGEASFAEHRYVDTEEKFLVDVGHDVWIGNNVSIFDGVSIGNGAIVGAGAIVTKNILPYTIVGGIPARKIRMRFEPHQTAFLERFRWWDRELQWLRANYLQFHSIDEFMRRFAETAER